MIDRRFFVFAQLLVCAVSIATADPIALTDTGWIRGRRHVVKETKQVIDCYLGIPYARPPVGELRFRHPLPMDKWNGTYDAVTLPKSCVQSPDTQFGDFDGATVWNSPTHLSEDCLYLNVFAPKPLRRRRRRHPSHRPMATMVWIYGGGFYSGTTTLAVYDGSILAARGGVVVVSVGYRLGALGFLTFDHPSAPGNAGLFDQLMALSWIQKNIEAFGGSPDDVTLFGESAGAVSVSLHLLSPLSSGRFSRAILQSGSANMPWATTSADEGKRRALELSHLYLGANREWGVEETVTWLRSLPAQRIVDAQWVSRGPLQFPFLPVVDGVFLSDSVENLLRRGRFKKCPILFGSNANEGSNFVVYDLSSDSVPLNGSTMTRSQYVDGVTRMFHYYPQYPKTLNQRAVQTIALQYMSPTALHSSGRKHAKEEEEEEEAEEGGSFGNVRALEAAVGDSQFVCPLNDFAEYYAREGLAVYAYYFAHRYSSNPWPRWMGVVHGDEIFFVFGESLKQKQKMKSFSEDEKALSRTIISYWTNFAKSGSPNHPLKTEGSKKSLKEWPRYDPGSKEYIQLSLNIIRPEDGSRDHIRHGLKTKECLFWKETLHKLIASDFCGSKAFGNDRKCLTTLPSQHNPVASSGGKRTRTQPPSAFISCCCCSASTTAVAILNIAAILHSSVV